jgi:hypothetical protein
MATTTNYGWTTPDDTALVKDGAAAIRTLGTSVDTTTKNLNPSTTLGDIEYRSSTANTNTRLGIGSNGQILTVSGGVPSWATAAGGGGMTLLSTTSLSGTATVISSIDQTYKNLEIIIFGFTANTNAPLRIAPNGDFGISRSQNTATFTTVGTGSNEAIRLTGNDLSTNNSNTNAFSTTIFNYASTTAYKPFRTSGTFTNNSAADFGTFGSGGIATTSAITSITVNCANNTFASGTVLVYGVK